MAPPGRPVLASVPPSPEPLCPRRRSLTSRPWLLLQASSKARCWEEPSEQPVAQARGRFASLHRHPHVGRPSSTWRQLRDAAITDCCRDVPVRRADGGIMAIESPPGGSQTGAQKTFVGISVEGWLWLLIVLVLVAVVVYVIRALGRSDTEEGTISAMMLGALARCLRCMADWRCVGSTSHQCVEGGRLVCPCDGSGGLQRR